MDSMCALTLKRNRVLMCLLTALLPALLARSVAAQTPTGEAKPADAKAEEQVYQTLYLSNATDQVSLNDIQTDLRNMLPRVKVYGIPSQNAISLRGSPEDIATAQRILADIDRPIRVYRLTYTITETGSGQAASARHYTLMVASGNRTVFKQGERVPIITGNNTHDAPQGTQVQYADVGLNIEATLATSADALILRSKVEQSSLAAPSPGAGARDPDIRQTVLDGTSSLVLNKPSVLGSLDVPGTSRHEDIEVVAELVR